MRAAVQETILNDSKVKDAAHRRRAERESAFTLEERVAHNAKQKERAAELKRQQVRSGYKICKFKFNVLSGSEEMCRF